MNETLRKMANEGFHAMLESRLEFQNLRDHPEITMKPANYKWFDTPKDVVESGVPVRHIGLMERSKRSYKTINNDLTPVQIEETEAAVTTNPEPSKSLDQSMTEVSMTEGVQP